MCRAIETRREIEHTLLSLDMTPSNEDVHVMTPSNEDVHVMTHSNEDTQVMPESLVSQESLAPGYDILEEIGNGATGKVYKAWQKSLRRFVAIKVVTSLWLSKDETCLKRLELEAETMARLKHPNIIAAIDFGFQREYYYIVMEYVEGGKTLRNFIEERGHLSEKETLELGLAIAHALEYLRLQHIVHRDIKPSNILLDIDGTPKLADLGLIKDTHAEIGLTKTGSFVGTPAYMPLEQLQGERDIDIRADIYSLGASMLHALTGKSRFDASATIAVIYHEMLSECKVNFKQAGKISPQIKHILSKMLQPKREDRYQTPQELIEDIKSVLAGTEVAQRPNQQNWRLDIILLSICIFLLLCLIVVVLLFAAKL